MPPFHEGNAKPRKEATVPTKPSRWQRALDLLRAVRNHATGAKRKRAQQAVDAAKNIPTPAPVPPPKVTTPPPPHGFMPGAIVKMLPTAGQSAIIPVGVIEHIAVSDGDTLFPLFSNDGGVESHFYVRKDGTFEQYRSIFLKADAQFDGNAFGSPLKGFVSVENQGGVGADLAKGLTPAQLAKFKEIVLWVKSESDFPLRVCPAWDAPGVGYHAMFHEWNLTAHSCPGAGRIAQFNHVIVPWLKAGGKP